MDTKHTPTPYYVAENSGGYAIRVSSVTLGKPVHYDVTVAVLSCDPMTADQSKATAEFIARACNSHHELLAALEAELAHLEYDMSEARTAAAADEIHARIKLLQSALAKATR